MLADNSVAKLTLEKSWVHNNLIKSKIREKKYIGEQSKVNKCRTESGKKKIYIFILLLVLL